MNIISRPSLGGVGKNDPYVICSLGNMDWKPRTETQWDAGEEANWVLDPTDSKWKLEVTRTDLCTLNFKVVVMDANKVTKDKLIGQGEISLMSLADAGVGGDYQMIEVPLLAENSTASKGLVTVEIMLDPTDAEQPAPKLDPVITNFDVATLCVRRIEADEMKNVESKMGQLVGDHNDPYASLSLGTDLWESGKCPRTSTLWNSGKRAVWDIGDVNDKHWRIPVTKELLLQEKLSITLTDANTNKPDVQIGVTSLSLGKLAEVGVNGGLVELIGTLTGGSKGKDRGTVKVSVCLLPITTKKIGNTSFKSAVLGVKSIRATQLANVSKLRTSFRKKEKKEPVFTEGLTVLRESVNNDNFNQNIAIAFLAILCYYILYVLWNITLPMIWFLISSRHDRFMFVGSAMGKLTSIGTILFLMTTYHRFLGYLMSLALRSYFQNKYENTDCWDMHFGWVSYRGFLDLNELRFHDIIWRNPSSFIKTPFLMHIKSVTISFDITTVFAAATMSGPLKILNIIIDSPEVYIEKADGGEVLNIFSASGKPNQKGFVKEQMEKLMSKIKMMMTMKSNGKEKEKTHIYHAPKKMITFDIHRLIVFNTTIHLLDMINRKYCDATSNNDIFIKTVIAENEDLTGDPITPGGSRTPFTDTMIINAMAEKMANIAIQTDTTHMAALMGHIIFYSSRD